MRACGDIPFCLLVKFYESAHFEQSLRNSLLPVPASVLRCQRRYDWLIDTGKPSAWSRQAEECSWMTEPALG